MGRAVKFIASGAEVSGHCHGPAAILAQLAGSGNRSDHRGAGLYSLPLADWPRYLAYRKQQGFTALQISILPVTYDMSVAAENIPPFLSGANGQWDFSAYNPAYFDKAETMVAMAVEQGFVPVLGVLWCSYVPGARC
ncbi:MAG TPA: DUF4038 domain-containing protein [Caldilineaceae bacterium]|nr:DUF4038 domain-containing protein [Caldilineaceae bacterium]